MVLGLTSLSNPVKINPNITVRFFGDVSEWTETKTTCSILNTELKGNLVIGGFFWSTKISKPAIIIGYLLGFRFSTKDEIKVIQQSESKQKIIEVWDMIVHKHDNPIAFLMSVADKKDLENCSKQETVDAASSSSSASKIETTEEKKSQNDETSSGEATDKTFNYEDEIKNSHKNLLLEEIEITDSNDKVNITTLFLLPKVDVLEQIQTSQRIMQLLFPDCVEEQLKELMSGSVSELRDHILMLRKDFLFHSSALIKSEEEWKKEKYDAPKIPWLASDETKKAIISMSEVTKKLLGKDYNEYFQRELGVFYLESLNISEAMKIYSSIMSKYKNNSNLALQILRGKPWMGMNKEMVVDALGEPLDEQETAKKGTIKTKLFYNGRKNQMGNITYGFRVDLENDIVDGWKELE